MARFDNASHSNKDALEQNERKDGLALERFVQKAVPVLFIICITACALIARYAGRGFVGADAQIFLLPWFDTISEGGAASLGTQIGNYGIPYQIIIFFGTLLPINPLYWYKMVSIAFDLALAVVTALLVRKVSSSRKLAMVTYAVVLLQPVFIVNSSVWAQCDSIYTTFVVLSLLLLLSKRDGLSAVFLGVAFAFKLQAVFVLPFYIAYYLSGASKFKLRYLVFLFLGFYVPSLPGVIAGRSWLDPFTIYMGQVSEYDSMFLNYPSFWCLASSSETIMKLPAIAITCGLLLTGIWAFITSPRRGEATTQLLFAAWIAWCCVLFLPEMHERYGYVAMTLLIVCFMLTRSSKVLVAFLVMMACDCMTYNNFLFGGGFSLPVLALLMCGAFAVYTTYVLDAVGWNLSSSAPKQVEA